MDFRVSARTHAMTVAKTASVLGTQLPADYLEQVEQVDAFEAAVANIAVTTDQLHAAVFASIKAGKDYREDPHVQRLALDRQLTESNIGEISARPQTSQLLAAALADHADAILDDWADKLEPHATALAIAADANLNLNNADDVVARGGAAMHQLHHAQVAVKAWTEALRGFYALCAASGISYSGTGPLALTPARKAELARAYDMAHEARTDIDAWVLARCAIPLQLATIGDFVARVATFNADSEAARREHAKRAAAAGFDR